MDRARLLGFLGVGGALVVPGTARGDTLLVGAGLTVTIGETIRPGVELGVAWRTGLAPVAGVGRWGQPEDDATFVQPAVGAEARVRWDGALGVLVGPRVGVDIARTPGDLSFGYSASSAWFATDLALGLSTRSPSVGSPRGPTSSSRSRRFSAPPRSCARSGRPRRSSRGSTRRPTKRSATPRSPSIAPRAGPAGA